MSFKAVSTLQQLAIQGLLADEDLAISALEDLPTRLFPPLFQEAFIKRQKKVVKAMVAAWPFPCLPAGGLMKNFRWDNFQALLDGLDLLSKQNARPRRWNLQVLDLQDTHHDFWEVQSATQDGVSSPQTEPGEEEPPAGMMPPLKVVAEYSLVSTRLNEYNDYFMRWLRRRGETRPRFFFSLANP